MTLIRYADSAEGLRPVQLRGFFDGWPNPPTPETHLRVLERSYAVVLAIDEATERVVGFITALSDGVLTAYIPLLEVLPTYRGKGIGLELVRRMLERLGALYAVDVLCDPEVQPFYSGLGMQPAVGMMIRRYARQSGG